MSDYLWDRTGEPDADVKELEELLGSLAYQPRPLELPELPRERVTYSLAWTRVVAVAAALLLMLLAGAALMSMRRQAVVTPEERAVQQPSPLQIETPERRAVETSKDDEDIALRRSDDLPESKPMPRNGSRSMARQAASSRQQRQLPKRRRDEMPAPVSAEIAQSQKHELTDEQRRAKDQLMLALRFASDNLKYVQEQVHEVSMAEKPR